MRRRWIFGAAVALALVGCADDGQDAAKAEHERPVAQDVKAPASSSDDLEMWTHAAPGGKNARVKVAAPDAMRPCTMVKVGEVAYAALWPQGAIREEDGVRVGDHLVPFDAEVVLRGRTYQGGPTTTACLASELWMVLGAS